MPAFLESRPLFSSALARPHSEIHEFAPATQSAASLPSFSGVRIYPEFLSAREADALLDEIDSTDFQSSQSGKEKQHYGPKINFNKKKMNSASFRGLPAYAHRLEARLRERVDHDTTLEGEDRNILERALTRFETTDVFVLRYTPRECSNLDFHVDDFFAYGEVILDVSLESDSVLTFLRGRPNNEIRGEASSDQKLICVRVPLPARSIAVLHGSARFTWEHAILAYDIAARRTSVTLRTLGEPLRNTNEGRAVLTRARRTVD